LTLLLGGFTHFFYLSFKGVRDSLCLIVCRQAKANVCPDSYRDAEAEIQFFVRWGVLFFLGLAQVSPRWSAGHCRNTAKLSAKLRSIEKTCQDVKGRYFCCLSMVAVS